MSDLAGRDGIERRDLIQYTYPSDRELADAGVTGLFLGHYLPWDGASNALIAGVKAQVPDVDGADPVRVLAAVRALKDDF